MTDWTERVTPAALADRTAYDHDMYGVEVEVEYNYKGEKNLPAAVHQFWSCVPDGSLRNYGKLGDQAVEFRYSKPLNSFTSAIAVKLLCQTLNTNADEIYNSGRTSTHVHVNVCNITKLQIMNLITLSVIFDELLVAQHHPFRRGNLFALRFVDAEWPIRSLVHTLKNNPWLKNFARDNSHRYASINLTSIARFGTIEYRAMDGALNAQRINQWVFCLHQLKKKAVGYKNPQEIIETYHRMGAMAFMREHIPPYYGLNLNLSSTTEMLTRGMLIAQDLAYASDWVSKVQDEDEFKRFKKVAYEDTINALIQSTAAAQLQAGIVPSDQITNLVTGNPASWPAPPPINWSNQIIIEEVDDL